MNTLIIDDEKPAVDLLVNFVNKVPFLNLTLATRDAIQGLDLLNNNQIDLMLLDIQMPDLTGIELLKSLSKKPLVIFTTAYDNYALEGFELDVLDYLVKPIRFDRFLKAINKAQILYNASRQNLSQKSEYLIIKVEYQNVKIMFSDILYIEGLKDYIKIHTNEQTYLTRSNLKNIQEKLPKEVFLRIHRSFIVPIGKTTSFNKGFVRIGELAIPVGKTYQDRVMKTLG